MHRVKAKGIVCTRETASRAVRVKIELWGKTVTDTT